MMTADSQNRSQSGTAESKQSSFLAGIARYFRDFLDTDFQRQRLPKRQIARQDRAGNLTGVPIKKYPQLIHEIWQVLHEKVNTGLSLKIPRGRFKANIDPQLSNLIEQYIGAISEESATTLMNEGKRLARSLLGSHREDPERFKNEVLDGLGRETSRVVIHPLLKHLEAHFDENNTQGLETIFDIESDLVLKLISNVEEAIGIALNTAIVQDKFDEYDELISDLYDVRTLQRNILEYFHTFTSSDFYAELHSLRATLRVHENMDVYLYIGDLHFNNIGYPIFYLPLHIEMSDASFIINVDPHLYINKKSVDYVSQEIARADGKTPPNLVSDRIIYLDSEETFAGKMQSLADKWAADLGLRPPIDFAKPLEQKARSSKVVMTNRLHFAAFDKSDEALLNDYEALLTMLDGGDSVIDDFKELINRFLYGDPTSVTKIVDSDWNSTPIEDRLVCRSPIPLNEEQRKILSAIKNSDSRFIVCSGPPGTGKSHTITAIAFDAILNGKNILVLSDKKEALDVVEDKLTKTLNSVRMEDDFQNPILRLGKSSNTYHKIISTQAIEKIKAHHRTATSNQNDLQKAIDSEEQALKGQIRGSAETYKAIDIREIHAIQNEEENLAEELKPFTSLFNDETVIQALDDVRALIGILSDNNFSLLEVLRASTERPSLNDIQQLLQLKPALDKQAAPDSSQLEALKLFNRFNEKQIAKLTEYIRRYEDLCYPLVGFLFTRKKAVGIDAELGEHLDCRSTLDLYKQLPLIKTAHAYLTTLSQCLSQALGTSQSLHYAFQVYVHRFQFRGLNQSDISKKIQNIRQFISSHRSFAEKIGVREDNVLEWVPTAAAEANSYLHRVLDFQRKYEGIRKLFSTIPEFDYIGQKNKLESLHTRMLANTIDERVIDFHDGKKTTAKTIREIIRKKQKFPKEQFEDLKQAFPCIIANIRDYAEFMPLAPSLFEVIIIDEASQVSIAQAFPAILRAKKMVVLGDAKQFSNVKTTNASRAINNQYLNEIKNNFFKGQTSDTNLLNRVHKFNIQTSILDFVEMVSNFGVMLKKHFRGYREHISYSSKKFYNGQLQAVKVRGKPIEEALEITVLEDDGKSSPLGNVNELEGDFILSKVEEIFNSGKATTVGIITPFTDQQRYLSQLFHKHPKSQDFYDQLKLKIMTFDSCQGEERETVFYSFVATATHDRLYGIFPKSFEDSGDPEHSLRLQRLNVGFSRVQEKMHLVLSKPIEQFSGALGDALRHYQSVLEQAKRLPTDKDVDPKSPMEKKVLDWIKQTEFYQRHEDQIEIVAGFPIGDYLRQLDPSYNHPAYEVDFLLKIRVDGKVYHLIIEYDGFKEHFTNLDEVDARNYHHYYKADDLEREKILESYGYRILRINRFNMGKDPVVTLSDRLHRLTRDIVKKNKPHELVTKIGEIAEELVNNDRKICKKCQKPIPIDAFRDPELKGGVGRICDTCKASRKTKRYEAKGGSRPEAKIDENVKCPRCDSPMIMRKGPRGPFYGCSRFPRCRGTRQC